MSVENTYDASHELAVASAAPAALEQERVAASAADALKKAISEGKVVESGPTGNRVFVAPKERNTAFLVNATNRKLRQIPDQNSPTGLRDMARLEEDIFLRFQEAICIITPDEPGAAEKIAWAESHPSICRDAADPLTEAWVLLMEGQVPTSRRDPTIPTGLDVDKLLSGDPRAARSKGDTATRAQQALVG